MLDDPHLMLPTTVEECAAAAAGGHGWLTAQLTLGHHRLRDGVPRPATPTLCSSLNPSRQVATQVLQRSCHLEGKEGFAKSGGRSWEKDPPLCYAP